RKPRPEIQIYRPGALRQGSGSTKNLSANDDRPPRPEKLTTTSSGNASRRRSNDTDSVTSRGGSGSTTPDAMVMNERGRNRFEGRGGAAAGGNSNYNSTQSLYDTRQHGGYMEYNGNGGGGGRFQNPNPNYHRNQQSQPFERNYVRNSRGFSERASMRGDGAIARRPQTTTRRQRNDSINSTQSEMPANNTQLHIDTSFDSASQCGASSFSMNSLGEAFSFEEMCQNLQNFASMDWSKEVENEFAMQKELEEEEERQAAAEEEAQMVQKTSQERDHRKNRRNRRNYDESDRESSFGGSIAEEKEPEDDPEEELRSGERTPTSIRSGSSYNPRVMYQKSRVAATNDENHHGRRQKESLSTKKEAPRRYRGEHDDRDDDTMEYSNLETSNTGRLAGRITIVPRNREQEENSKNFIRKTEKSK
ncbi:LOW QUALITY PROTEIN: Protein CBG15667, partial [Caenorhabditis briggsae]